MARRNNTTTTEAKSNRREYDLNHWVESAKDGTASNTRRVYCYAQAIVRLCKDEAEQSTPSEDGEYLADLVTGMHQLGTKAALAADAKAGRGVSEVAKRQNPTAQVNALQAQVAALMAQLAAIAPAPVPPAPTKGGRKSAK